MGNNHRTSYVIFAGDRRAATSGLSGDEVSAVWDAIDELVLFGMIAPRTDRSLTDDARHALELLMSGINERRQSYEIVCEKRREAGKNGGIAKAKHMLANANHMSKC